MRKLQILKAIVDFIWFVTCLPMALLLLVFTVIIFSRSEAMTVFFDFEESAVDASDIKIKVILLLFFVLAFIAIYCFYLFRKTLRYFQRIKPFHLDVIQNFYKIGYLLTIIGSAGTVLSISSTILIRDSLKISLGLSPYLGTICLGLFFMVLSEIFKVAKHAKEENELTV